MAITNRSVAEKASSKRKNSDPPSPSSSSAPEKRVRKEPSRLVLDRSSLTRIYESTNKSESVSSPSSSTTSSSSKLLNIVVDDKKKPLPVRNDKGQLLFADRPEFRPNKTPKEVLQAGSFGGTYFRPILSYKKTPYSQVHKEFPDDWFQGLSQARQLVSAVYHKEVNKYGVKCGGDLDMWESSGWISPIDPYGWFQWYCRFYLGRRCSDDVRQIARWRGVCGPTGRFKRQLLNKIRNTSGTWTDSAVSPVIRQTLLHWSYEITEEEYKAFCKEKA